MAPFFLSQNQYPFISICTVDSCPSHPLFFTYPFFLSSQGDMEGCMETMMGCFLYHVGNSMTVEHEYLFIFIGLTSVLY